MSNRDPRAPGPGAQDPRYPPQYGPRRTLGGALATAALFVTLLLATAAPTTVLVAFLLTPAAAGVVALTVGYWRRRSSRPVRFCLPGTDHCVQV